jgi:Zn-dependent protease
MNRGWLTLFRWRGIPVRAHWSLPVGAWMLSGFRIEPILWFATTLVVLVHEFGHAIVVRAAQQRVVSVDVHGFGGMCRWHGTATPIRRAAIAWGGVWAQMILLSVTLAWFAISGAPETRVAELFESAFVNSNLWLMALNLVPIAPLDGAEAWPLPGLLFRKWRKALRGRRFERAIRPRHSRVRSIESPGSGIDDAAVKAELERIERVEKELREVRPEVDQMLARVVRLGGDSADDHARVRAGKKAN